MKITWFDAEGQEHVLTDTMAHVPKVGDNCEMIVTRWTGVGMPDVEDITEEGPLQHGQTWLYGLLSPRFFRLDFLINNIGGEPSSENLARAVSELCKWFNPHSDPEYGLGRMRFEVNGVLREAVCRYDGGLKCDMVTGDASELREWVELRMPEPLFYDPTESRADFLYQVDEELLFPFTFPFLLGFSGISQTSDVVNLGDWEAYPIIDIIGPADEVTIENKTTNQLLKLEYAIAAGETVTIDLSYGAKTIENNFGDDLQQYLTPESDIAGWKLATNPEATDGINEVFVLAPNANVNTQVNFRWNDRYLSI